MITLNVDHSDQEVVVCRCEEITESEIRAAIQAGAHTNDAVKLQTRAGMGLCQGRTCSSLIAQLIRDETGIQFDELPPSSKRIPLRPIELSLFIQDVDD